MKPGYANSATVAGFSAGLLGGTFGIMPIKIILAVVVADCALVAFEEEDVMAPFSSYRPESLGNHAVNVFATLMGILAAKKAFPQETA